MEILPHDLPEIIEPDPDDPQYIEGCEEGRRDGQIAVSPIGKDARSFRTYNEAVQRYLHYSNPWNKTGQYGVGHASSFDAVCLAHKTAQNEARVNSQDYEG